MFYGAATPLLFIFCLLSIGCTEDSVPHKDSRPNILLIVLDDFGYNDLGVNGNPKTPTPNLDSFAQQGVRYTRHYADATCTASRVTLLTGKHPVSYTHLTLPTSDLV